jgi:hypothetical protein
MSVYMSITANIRRRYDVFNDSFFGGKGREVMRSLKDKKVIIYRKTTVKDSAGFATTKYIPIHDGRIWAYVRQLSAGEYYAAAALHIEGRNVFYGELA